LHVLDKCNHIFNSRIIPGYAEYFPGSGQKIPGYVATGIRPQPIDISVPIFTAAERPNRQVSRLFSRFTGIGTRIGPKLGISGAAGASLLGRCKQFLRGRQPAQIVQAERDHPIAERAREVAADQDRPIEGEADGEKRANTAFIDGVRKFVMDVRDLDIDLIDRINPFGEAYAILAKTMSEESLKQVHAVIAGKRINLTLDEARELAKRALKFKQERGRLPSITSLDAWEKRMAEGVAFLARMRARLRVPRFTEEDDALLEELGIEVETRKQASRTAREERSSPASRRFSASSKSTAMPRGTGKAATSSSGCTQPRSPSRARRLLRPA
jgi:hypothetical protein